MPRICTYNIAHFDRLFDNDNAPRLQGEAGQRLEALKRIFETLDADLIGIVEAPNTATRGQRSTVACLENFATWAGLRQRKALIGFPSRGFQELALLYDPDRLRARHTPGGRSNSKKNPRFDGEIHIDTDYDGIKEAYTFYRPPLEARIDYGEDQHFYLILVHAKSKGIFKATDMIHWQRESERNRRKLYAECSWIRRRVDEWMKKERPVVVMGDMNDGPGMDFYEYQFGRSAVEILMGDLFRPEAILRNPLGRPRWRDGGWLPYSARFRDRFTGSNINVLIDHILCCRRIPLAGERPLILWNPHEEPLARPLRPALTRASDHFPLTLDIGE